MAVPPQSPDQHSDSDPSLGPDTVQGPRFPARPLWFLFLFALSGAASLGYQAVWIRSFAAGWGSETPSVLAVAAAVMAGLGLGAWAADRVVSRSLYPGRWYVALEILIGLWGFLLAAVLPSLSRAAAGWVGLEPSLVWQAAVGFGVPLFCLLPATGAMGATLPAVDRLVTRWAGGGRWVGAVYGANTLGAAVGLWAVVGSFLPQLGLFASAVALAIINLLCAALAWALGAARSGQPRCEKDSHSLLHQTAAGTAGERRRVRAWVGIAAFTGFLGMGFEVLGFRLLSQVLENTVYTYAAVLSVFLLGTAVGALIYQYWGTGRSQNPDHWLGGLLGVLAISLAGAMQVIRHSPSIAAATRSWLDPSTWGAAPSELLVAASVFFIPTLLMGVIFSHLAQQLRHPRGGVGLALGVNATGAALAPPAYGLILLPAAGARWSLALTAVAYGLLGWWAATIAVRRIPHARGCWILPGAGIVIAASVAWFSPLRLLTLPPDTVVRRYAEGALGFVAVTEDSRGHRTLRVDNRFQMGGTAAADAEARQAHLPLLLHPAPTRALFLGVGTGITLGASTHHPDLDADGVELVPEVVKMMGDFAEANSMASWPTEWQVQVADARRFVAASRRQYDVIVGDLFHPARDGAGLLYTREHFQATRLRLAEGGLFCQWLPLHQLDDRSIRMIVRTFVDIFPGAELWWLRYSVEAPVVGLLGRRSRPVAGAQPLDARPLSGPLSVALEQVGLADPAQIQGLFICGAVELKTFSIHAPLNTDNRPAVVFTAPSVLRESRDAMAQRVQMMVGLSREATRRLSATYGPSPSADEARALRFRNARDRYVEGLLAEAEGREVEAEDAWVESVRLSADFTAAYARCLTRATAWLALKPDQARALLRRLAEAQPAIPVARRMLERLRDRDRKATNLDESPRPVQ